MENTIYLDTALSGNLDVLVIADLSTTTSLIIIIIKRTEEEIF